MRRGFSISVAAAALLVVAGVQAKPLPGLLPPGWEVSVETGELTRLPDTPITQPEYPAHPDSGIPATPGEINAAIRGLVDARGTDVAPAFARALYGGPPVWEAARHLFDVARIPSEGAAHLAILDAYARRVGGLRPISRHDSPPATYLVGSRIKDQKALGGYAKSSNLSRPIPSELPVHLVADLREPTLQDLAPGDGSEPAPRPKDPTAAEYAPAANLMVVARPQDLTEPADGVLGMAVYVVNPTPQHIALPAQDSSLPMQCEALITELGVWAPIEPPRTSSCGNSHHRVFLEPRSCWKLPFATFDGDYPTRLRFRLDVPGHESLLSNEFDARIHRDQIIDRCRTK